MKLSRLLLVASMAVLLGPCLATASAQDWAKAALARSPRHGEYVSIKEPGGRVVQAWVVYPEVRNKASVVVMVHEIFGMSDWSREMADEIAGAGYIVVEPDLLSGFGPAGDHAPSASTNGAALVPATPGGTAAFPDRDAAIRAVSSLDPAVVTAGLDAAADYGRKLPSANGKLFVAGFCWGGGQSFAFATHRKDLSAAFVFYGPPPPARAMKNIAAPVYGFYAGDDARITATVPQTTADMNAAGKTYAPVIYAGAGHGFMRAGEAPDANAADSAARAAGFRRLIKLLGGV